MKTSEGREMEHLAKIGSKYNCNLGQIIPERTKQNFWKTSLKNLKGKEF